MGRKRAEKTGIMEKSKGMIRLQPLYALEMVVFLLLATVVGMLFRKIGFTETNVVLLYILAVFVTSSLTRSSPIRRMGAPIGCSRWPSAKAGCKR